jgi:predicted metal-dependent phosphotriesterase family hydrolase
MPETITQLMRYKGFEKELIETIFVTNAATILTKA